MGCFEAACGIVSCQLPSKPTGQVLGGGKSPQRKAAVGRWQISRVDRGILGGSSQVS